VGPVDRLNFDLLILRSGDGYQARVIRSPGGEGDVAFALPDRRVSMERLLRGPPRSQPDPEAAPYVMLGQTGRPRAALAMADFGRHLFRSVFAGPVGLAYRRSLTATESQGQGLRIRLRLTEAPELLELPW